MASGLRRALHVREPDGERLAVECRGDPVHRPGEGIALQRVPAHRFPERYTTYNSLDQRRQRLGSRLAFQELFDHHAIVFDPQRVQRPVIVQHPYARLGVDEDVEHARVGEDVVHIDPVQLGDQTPLLERRYLTSLDVADLLLYIERLLVHTGGNRAQVARLLDVSYPTVAKKIADYGIKLPD